MHLTESAFGIGEGAAQKRDDLLFGQRLQHVDAAAREQRGVDFERRILGGRADQANAAFLDVRQKGILLRFVEAVDFVDEDDGARAVLAGALGIAHDLLDFLDAGEHGGELDEVGLGDAGNDLGERGFAGAGRAPEDHRGGIVALDLHAQRFAGADQVLLADEFIERARAHAVGERACALGGGIVVRDGREEVHKSWSQRSDCRGEGSKVHTRDFQITVLTSQSDLSLLTCSCGFVQHDAGGDSGIERFDLLWLAGLPAVSSI